MNALRTLAGGLTLVALGACGGGDTSDIRGGPQAVHPSPSALAQTGLIQTDGSDSCSHGASCHPHTHRVHGADGSVPIVD